ncbi:hypothetical protein MIR68_005752 [Amoeboaphelidium protococcarum]|nr:hypothetical protein MIR68_005752 [Amoeboaphelidium protococcarum]KAI3645926.1 hypothetical protein MP228_008854 [Amoeboaphelidium protococcarum]
MQHKANSVLLELSGMRYLWSFIGDYESLLMVHVRCPTRFSLSMIVKTIAAFVLFTTKQPESDSVGKDGRVVKDLLGNALKVQVGYNSPVNVTWFLPAVRAVHGALEQNDPI